MDLGSWMRGGPVDLGGWTGGARWTWRLDVWSLVDLVAGWEGAQYLGGWMVGAWWTWAGWEGLSGLELDRFTDDSR